MIISKDLFIFGEHIFATIIPEVGLSVQQPAQQTQLQQQQQQQQIGVSSFVDVAKTASIVVVSEKAVDTLKVISGEQLAAATIPTTSTTTTTTSSVKPFNKQETVAVVIAAAAVAAATVAAKASPIKIGPTTTEATIIKNNNNNNNSNKTSLNKASNACKDAVDWKPEIGENNLREQEKQRSIEIFNNGNNRDIKYKYNETTDGNKELFIGSEGKQFIINKVYKNLKDEEEEEEGQQENITNFQQNPEAQLFVVSAQENKFQDKVYEDEDVEEVVLEGEIIEQQPLVKKLFTKLNIPACTLQQPQKQQSAHICRKPLEIEERANVNEIKASATPSPSLITTSNINNLLNTEATITSIPSNHTNSHLNCVNFSSTMSKVMLGNNTRNDHTMVNLPFISDTSEQDSHHHRTIQLTFQNINFVHGDRKILSNISGIVNPGEVLAIMGPSGSGKTTLLDCLCGQRKPENGSIFLNREPLSKKWRRKICYVLQEEIFFSGLTLRETVMYTAMLRLPEKMHKRKKIQLVDRILKELELNCCEQTKFGDYMNRGLSGGEKKRANIACELLTNPLLMLLDEPSSGLDSHSAISLMRVLKRYAAQERKTVVITVHQPSSQMFHMFDKLLLLYNGHTAYFGEVKNIYQYFEDVGLAIKPHYNPADFLLEQLKSFPEVREKLFVAAKKSYYNFLDSNCMSVNTNVNNNHHHDNSNPAIHDHKKTDIHGNVIMQKNTTNNNNNKNKTHKHDVLINDIINNYYNDIQSNNHHHHINNDTVLIMDKNLHNHDCNAEDTAAQQLWCGSESNFSSSSCGTAWVDNDNDLTENWLDYPTQFWTQLSVLTSRSFKESKPRMLSKLNWFQTIGLALMAGAIWFNIPRTEEYLHDLQGWMFFSQTYWMLFALFGALNSFPSEREVISKERRSGAYRLSAYYLAKMFAELPLVITLPTVYLIISYPMLGCSSLKLFFLMLVFLLLNTIVAQSVGFFIGAYCMDMNVSITLSALYTLATQLFGGYLSSRIPEGLSWIRFTSMIHYAYQNMQILEFREGPKISCGIPSSYEVCKTNATKFIPYEEILKAQNSTSPLWLNTLILMMFFLVFRGLGYAVLRFIRCPKST